MDALKLAREQTVRDHMRMENEGDWDGVLATFAWPRYEFQVPFPGVNGPQTVFDGRQEVLSYHGAARAAFPDLGNEIIYLTVGDDNIAFVEMYLIGTHLGELKTPLGNIPATGKRIKVRMSAVFEFAPGSEKIISERPYTDPRAILVQLGAFG